MDVESSLNLGHGDADILNIAATYEWKTISWAMDVPRNGLESHTSEARSNNPENNHMFIIVLSHLKITERNTENHRLCFRRHTWKCQT